MRSKIIPRALVPCLALAVLQVVLGPPPARAGDLLSEDVLCNRAQLVGLLERARVRAPVEAPGNPARPRPTTLFVTYSSPYGFYQGLALDGPWHNLPGGGSSLMPEYHLAFGLNPTLRTVLLNPERPMLDQIGLAREESNTTRVSAGSAHALTLTLDPTLASALGTPPNPAALLEIDNLADGAAGRHSSDSKPGRGLAVNGITDLCPGRFTARDLEVFAILQRTLRVRAHGADFDDDVEIALYRGQADGTYVAEIFAVDTGGAVVGSLALSVEIRLDSTGRLGPGTVRGLAACGPGSGPPCSDLSLPFDVYLGPPALPGSEVFDPDGPDTVHLAFTPGGSPAPGDVASPVDFGALLDGSTWNRPDRFAAQCGHGNPDDLAATPRLSPLKELLAIRLSGEVAAPEALYRRIVADTEAMADLVPRAHTEGAVAASDPSVVDLTVGPGTAQAMLSGGYHAWSCLNTWYEEQQVSAGPAAAGGNQTVIVRFDGIYDTARVAQDYRGLPGVLAAGPAPPPPTVPGNLPPRLCATADGDTIHYVASGPAVERADGTVRPVEFFYFVSSAAGEVTLEGTYNAGANPFVQPTWATLYGDC